MNINLAADAQQQFAEDFGGFVQLIRDAPDLVTDYWRQLSEVDKEISAIYHRIEVTTFNAVDGYRFARELQTTLRRRRLIKTKLAIAQALSEVNRSCGDQLRRTHGQIEHLITRHGAYANGWQPATEPESVDDAAD